MLEDGVRRSCVRSQDVTLPLHSCGKGTSEPESAKLRKTGVLVNVERSAWCEEDVTEGQRERSEYEKPGSPAFARRSGRCN
ncbi:hypothetical protein Y032_0157g3206 [Ancylostoma ceylanicum]|uniref:Uncharacterized protein n=1 Tax=Ancylostoma ceylanicum TaxID=53326 RepID=A0A016SYY0_9BILA|nr:hypothetical protein Y032_0157g3206 [Ancylostoma ceylanicum]